MCRFVLNLAILLTLAASTAAFAEDRGNQAPEGSWLYTVSIPTGGDPFVFQGTETYTPGGIYTDADQLSFMPGSLATPGHGEWKSHLSISSLRMPRFKRSLSGGFSGRKPSSDIL